MSAYLVSHYHLNCLVAWSRAKRIVFYPNGTRAGELDSRIDDHAHRIGDLLRLANEESVNQRYRLDDLAPPFRFKPDAAAARLPALVILKACACLDYQSCEFDGWQSSPARRILQRIQHFAIGCLPGFDTCPGWELQPPEGKS